MDARIYQPPKNAMQSGRGGSGKTWVLEFEPSARLSGDGLMGWPGGGETSDQVRLRFTSCQAAEAYAKRQGLSYQVIASQPRRVRPKSYADNFRFVPAS